jgi:hypothetical protein
MASVHFEDGGRGQDDPGSDPLCDDPLAADGFRAPGLQHSVQHRHADGGFGLLGSKSPARARSRGPISAL